MAAAHRSAADREGDAAAFADSAEQILAELVRIDLMIRARVARFRGAGGQDEQFRGLYISEAEVDALLARPPGRPAWSIPLAPAREQGLAALTAAVAARRARSLAAGVPLRLERLVRCFGLDDFARDVLLVAFAVEVDLRYERLYAYLQDDVTRRRPSVELAIQLLDPAREDLFGPRRHFAADAPLLRHRLIALVEDPQHPAPPLLARYVKLDDRIAAYLCGSDAVDDRLAGATALLAPDAELAELPLAEAAAAMLRNAAPREGGPVIVLQGVAGAGLTAVAAALAGEGGRTLLAIDVERLSYAAAPDWAMLGAVADREAALQGAMLLWIGLDRGTGEGAGSPDRSLLDAIDGGHAPALAGATGPGVTARLRRRGALTIILPALTPEQRLGCWRAALDDAGEGEGLDLPRIAAQLRLDEGQIAAAARLARHLARARRGDERQVTRDELLEACRAGADQGLSRLARKAPVAAGWDDLVLPDDAKAQLREMCAQVRHRALVLGDWGFGDKLALGKGVAALFAGPSGTGKTMAAGVIAAELGLDLYKIDLASVISKYIGETEKNLGRLFDEARDLDAILFFDEADALFGKRSEVRDSHDRYANVEVGYLLQRIEEHEGVAILATNLRRNMDDAFVRRLAFILEFPFPTRADRRRIWEKVWPAGDILR